MNKDSARITSRNTDESDIRESIHDVVDEIPSMIELNHSSGAALAAEQKQEGVVVVEGEQEDESQPKDEFGRETSPIPEVAAVVANTDDPSIPCMTFRFWVMGLISIFTLSFINQAPMAVGSLVIQLLSYPVGQFMARVIPTRLFHGFGFQFHLNPGPFNVKEHVLITIMNFGFLANLLLILTTQLVGYGILRRYLVYPAAMIWPSNLVTVALFNTLHTHEELAQGQWARQKFFAVFRWRSQGLGMGVISLDWNTITAFLGSPLITPFWAQVNIMMGFVLIAWIMVPVAYYVNPILTSKLFTVDWYYYDTLSILTPQRTLDATMYSAYGPLRIATFFAISYGVGFAGLTAIIMHTFLYHRKQIWAQWKQARGASQDEVPEWWYLGLFLLTVILAIVTCEVWDYGLPWWCVLLAVGISALFSLPIGLIQAVTNQQPGLNILTEFVIGYILPGRPTANTYDLKLGQYMKIPPKAMFMTQLIGTWVVNLVTANCTRPNICTPEGYPWTCPGANVFFSASAIWGIIAPERMFGPRSIYHPLMCFFLFGFLLPIPFYLFSRRYPGTIIHTPVLLTSTGMMPPARPYQYANWLMFSVKRYRQEWYQRFNYVLSAAMDAGVAIAALVILFTVQMHDVDWWGTRMDHCPLDKANFDGHLPVGKPKPIL
ncbi:MAG: LOW QUALITY PROTEIN: OPT family small oligopeptide transporter [Benniella sp.]|nr:MAG: LOW QUALITY PROTEIN: OPT family small oligopeptide transporter [Benniella sp.]